MQWTSGTTLDTVSGILGFLDAHEDVLGDITQSGARKALDDVAKALQQHAGTQDGSNVIAQGSTSRKRALRKVLRDTHMSVIAAIAAERLTGIPEFAPFKLPPANRGTAQLVAAAYGMADAAALHHDVFVARGLPQDFEAQLRAAAQAVSEQTEIKKTHVGLRGGATRALLAEEKHARQLIRVIDRMVRPKLEGNELLLGNWLLTKRIARKTSVRATAATQAPAPATPAPTQQAA